MLGTLLLSSILIATIYVMVQWGIARTFVYVFVPSILFFSLTPPVRLPGLPNLVAETAIGYGVIIGFMLAFNARWKEVANLRFNVLDIFILLMMIPPTISVFLNDSLWDAISKSGSLFFRWVLPYFMGRIAFMDYISRKQLVSVLCYCTIALGCLAAVEARLKPYMVTRAMQQVKLARTANVQVFYRFGLMRAQTSLGHPIDLGNMGVILGGMIIMLTPIVGRKWNDGLPMLGIFGAGAMVIGAVSFTGVVATLAAFMLIVAFTRPSLGAKLVIPAVVTLIIMVALLMNNMLNKEIPEQRPTDALEASIWIRVKIVQEGWEKAMNAGLFGEGQYLTTQGIGTGSIDNAYILFVMQYGWFYLAMWLMLSLLIAWYGAKTLALAKTPSERIPIAAACAALIAVMLAMYTVFFGFVYGLFFLVLVGFLSSMWQIFQYRPAMQVMPYYPPEQHPIGYAQPTTRGGVR